MAGFWEVIMEISTKDIIERIRDKEKCTLRDATYLTELFIDVLQEALCDEKCTRVRLKKIGVFAKSMTAGHVGRNPRSGSPVEVKPMTRISYRPSREVKEKINELSELRNELSNF
jgi:integration host factor subunit beta